jgi:hypothetical protein
MMRALILVLALSAPAMARVDSMKAHRVCMRQALDATNPTLDDSNMPVDLAEALHQYGIRLNTIYEVCMLENGFKLHTDWQWCAGADPADQRRSMLWCYEPKHSP